MDSYLLGALSALWLGILTSISPCPLAANIAAVSFICKRLENKRKIILAGVYYTGGRMLAYSGLSVLLLVGVMSIPDSANFLQNFLNKLLGPLLIIVGMVLVGLLEIPFSGTIGPGLAHKLGERGTLVGNGLLGILFALSFCPVSAALFFGSLIPLSLNYSSAYAFPLLYGFGTGLPVLILGLGLALGAHSIGTIYNKIAIFEWWTRRITGSIFILVGAYYALIYIFKAI